MLKRNRWECMVAALVLCALCYSVAHYQYGPSPRGAVRTSSMIIATAQAAAESQPNDQQEKEKRLVAQFERAVIRKGDGIERILIRQLIADPQAFGFTGDAAHVKAWAGTTAHLIAVHAGYFDWKFGAEIRIVHPGKAAFILEKSAEDGLRVVEYAQRGNAFQKICTRTMLASGNPFLGTPGHEELPAYEYVAGAE